MEESNRECGCEYEECEQLSFELDEEGEEDE